MHRGERTGRRRQQRSAGEAPQGRRRHRGAAQAPRVEGRAAVVVPVPPDAHPEPQGALFREDVAVEVAGRQAAVAGTACAVLTLAPARRVAHPRRPEVALPGPGASARVRQPVLDEAVRAAQQGPRVGGAEGRDQRPPARLRVEEAAGVEHGGALD